MVHLAPRTVLLALCLGCLVTLLTASRAEAALQVGLDSPEMAMTAASGELPVEPVIADCSDSDLQMKDVLTSASSSPTMLGVASVRLPVVSNYRLSWIDDAVEERYWPLLIEGVPKLRDLPRIVSSSVLLWNV